jgi:tetratricopeptide (TPR) repeat protein
VTYSTTLLFAVFFFFSLAVSGQVGVDYDLKKPPKFENRILASETSNNGKKFKKSRRFIQNTITHYNFYFNANEKLNTVIARAKLQNRDDYTKLLPFYNYTLEATSGQKKDLDSVIYKCTMGILIHDTRNDWIDNLYLLIGKTYYLKKDFDSAYITFQFLNYAFAPKEKDGYDIPIGSNYNADDGGNANTVSTKEKPNLLQKVFSLPPSRNDALIWKTRTYIAEDQFAQSASLIQVLRHDPQFPPRLQSSLQEVTSWWFYKQNIYDSAAWYLDKALPAAQNNEEKARWEYLIAQLYENIHRTDESRAYYERTVKDTYNPILEVYARLNSIRQNKQAGEDFIQKNIEALVKMAKKDRYESYRDIIYYTAAQMELERHNRAGAAAFLLQCVRSSVGQGNGQRNKAFLQLANLSFEDKKYKSAKNYYDSLNMMDRASLGDISWLPDRKSALNTIVTQLLVLERQDSLQRIAALPPDQRDALIKKMVKALRKLQGLRDEDQQEASFNSALANNTAIPDLFSSGSGSGDWYFYNPSLKSKGYSDFKTKWGNRPNVDNWQVAALAKQQQLAKSSNDKTPAQMEMDSKAGSKGIVGTDYKSLLNNLPLTPEKMKISNDSVERALFALGKAYQEGLPDYPYAINAYESLLEKFAKTSFREQTLANLYYCYSKIGDMANADRILAMMKKQYPDGQLTALATNPDSTIEAENRQKVNATHQYEKIYTSFIEGRFDEAMADKKVADSLYGSTYWTPQLLYIEAVYLIRSRQDPQAKIVLTNIQSGFSKTPMADKAARLLDVLNRRRQIESYLTNLQVKRAEDDSIVVTNDAPAATAAAARKQLVRNDSNMLVREDTSQLARARIHLPSQSSAAQGQKPASTIPGLDKLKVDTASMNKIKMDAGQIARLHQQLDSLDAAMKKAQSDSARTALLKRQSDSLQTAMTRLQADTAQRGARIRALNSVFSLTPDKPHSVMIVLEKVDPVYVTETRNAFNRYDGENFYGQSLSIENVSLNDSLKLVIISHFDSAGAALDYLQKAKAMAPREIVPWLPVAKYRFLIISGANLDLLMGNKDMQAYRRFLQTVYPGTF